MMLLTMRGLIEAASKVTGYSVGQITGGSRKRPIIMVRVCIIHIANRERLATSQRVSSRWTLPQIAKAMGYADHSTPLHLISMWGRYCCIDPSLPDLAAEIERVALLQPEPEPEPESEPEPEPVPESFYTRPRNDFRPKAGEEVDGGHAFHASMARASRIFVEALLNCRRGFLEGDTG